MVGAVAVHGVEQHIGVDNDHQSSATLGQPASQCIVFEVAGEGQRLHKVDAGHPEPTRRGVRALTGLGVAPDDETAAHLLSVYEVNVLGVVRMLHAFLPLLKRSDSPVVVNVSSGLGSLTYSADPSSAYSSLIVPAYFSSKAALNMLTLQYAKAFPAIRINAADPGFTATDLNDHRGTQTVTEGTDAIVQLATIGPDGPTGTFVSRHGPVPW